MDSDIGNKPLKIGIIGAGFSGTALAATLHRLSHDPLEIFLFEKTGSFGAGDAYSTSYPFHLLNVRACDMSAFEDKPEHFVSWLQHHPEVNRYLNPSISLKDQFVPRFLYRHYLQSLLKNISSDPTKKTQLKLETDEVIDILSAENQTVSLIAKNKIIQVDQVILALGNYALSQLPFPILSDIPIKHAWEYTSSQQILTHDPVLILGTGLSMIDTVLTLNQQKHQGKIYAVSRHGLLPLTHADNKVSEMIIQESLPRDLRKLIKFIRFKSKNHMQQGGDWRSIINALRMHIPELWMRATLPDRKRFLRHVLPYWNIHRHRVHHKIAMALKQLCDTQQLEIMAGHVLAIEKDQAKIKLRKTQTILETKIKWLINGMGPAFHANAHLPPLITSLLQRGMAVTDPLNVGLAVSATGAIKEKSGQDSKFLYTLGPPARSAFWECSAVPEIRKQCFNLANHLLKKDILSERIDTHGIYSDTFT